MEKQISWVDYLNVSPAQLEAWKLEAPDDIPMLVWALREGKINFSDYAVWAKGHYEIPVVRHEFFTQALPPSHAEADLWSPWMVPLAEWESITYVGCVMPPPDPEQGLVYVLAHPNDLESAYAKLAPSSTNDVIEEVAEDMPLPAEAPAGFSLNLNVPQPSSPPPAAPVIAQDQPATEAPAAPAGFTLNLNIPSAAPSEVSAPLSAPPEIPPPDAEPPIDSMDAPEPTNVTQITQVTQMTNVAPSPAPLNKEEASNWWTEASKKFSHALVLDASSTDFSLVWKNGASLDGSVRFSASQPSLFRIAQRTQKPYHGFVVENEIHSSFFKHLGMEKYPANVTALLVAGQILVLFGVQGELTNSELVEAEKLAEKFQSLKSVPKAA